MTKETITIKIENYQGVPFPQLLGFIDEENIAAENRRFIGMVVQASSVIECLEELTKSMTVLERFTGKKIM